MPDPSPPAARGIRAGIDWWFRNRTTGRIVVAQFPNVAFGIVIVVAAYRRIGHPTGRAGTAAAVIGTVALAWWAGDEILRGVNPWRRLLGIVVLAAIVARLVVAIA